MHKAIGEGFIDHQSGIANARTPERATPTLRSGGPRGQRGRRGMAYPEVGERAEARGYLTSFNTARAPRRWPCGDFGWCDVSSGPATGVSASHNAFNSRSAT